VKTTAGSKQRPENDKERKIRERRDERKREMETSK